MKTIKLTDELYDYVVRHSPDPHPVLAALRAETARLPGAGMQIAPDQGTLMHLLVKLIGARRIIEVGCYTGYSAICLASALPTEGQLVTLDVNTETAQIARRYFTEAGLESRIDLRIAPALETLADLHRRHGDGAFDLMFIDADKTNMWAYYEIGLKLVRTGGLILADNVLWSGKVIGPDDGRPETAAIRQFNDRIAADERVDRTLLTVSDGLYVLRKR